LFLSWFASKYVRIITGMRIKDTTAGFVCYRRETLQHINFDNITFVGYAFQIEMKLAVWMLELKVIEVPITFKDRELGTSKMSGGIIKEAVWGVLQMKWAVLKNKYIYNK
jgi:dolichol-phosphate mannosyltransferase